LLLVFIEKRFKFRNTPRLFRYCHVFIGYYAYPLYALLFRAFTSRVA
jgi:hypothetical protein